MFMCGLDFLFSQSTKIVIVIQRKDSLVHKSLELIRNIFNPNKIVVLVSDHSNEDFNMILSFTKDTILKEN